MNEGFPFNTIQKPDISGTDVSEPLRTAWADRMRGIEYDAMVKEMREHGQSPALAALPFLHRYNAAMRYALEHGFPPSRASTLRERFRDNLAAGLFWLGERLINLATRVSS